MPPRKLQLIIYHSPLFAAHWAFFLPSFHDSLVGTRIHADGSPAFGFEVLVEPSYRLVECTQSYQVVDFGDDVRDEDVERIARSVPAPQKSLVAVSASGPRRRVEMKNCQTWIRSVVVKMVEAGLIGAEALAIVEEAPKN